MSDKAPRYASWTAGKFPLRDRLFPPDLIEKKQRPI